MDAVAENILIVGSALALFFSLAILNKKVRNKPDFILSLFFLIVATTILLSYFELYNRKNDYPFPALIHTSTPLIFLHGPLIWLYIQSLTTQNFKFKFSQLAHFIPFITLLLFFLVNFYIQPDSEKIAVDMSLEFKNTILFGATIAAIAFSTQGYFLYSFVTLKKYRLKLKAVYSHIEHLKHNWLKHVLVSAIFFYGLISLMYALDATLGMMPFQILQTLGYVIASGFIFSLGLRGLKAQNVFTDQPLDINIEKTVMKQNFSKNIDQKDESEIYNILEYMKSKKPYLDPEINIKKLSNAMNIQPEKLSELINKELRKNFFDFINSYRVEEFKQACTKKDFEKYTIISIAYDCGFSSKATFNRVFKQYTGLTPGQYIHTVLKK